MAAPWLFAEFPPAGVDLSSKEAVESYDRNQGTDSSRDRALLDRLHVGLGTRIVDLACGTGSFIVEAAVRGAEAHGVDVSARMLEFTRHRAEAASTRVAVHHAGFLTYRHQGSPADVVTIKSALHQLPDFWKQTALLNIAGYIKPGGLLYIWDVIFTFPPAE
jgi:putative AdoMet-dependent methyltransferase